MSRGVAVLGAGGHAQVVIAALRAMGQSVLGAFSDAEADWGTKIAGIPILGPLGSVGEHGIKRAVLAMGGNDLRRRFASELDLDWITVRHPFGWLDESVTVGAGAMVMAGVVVQPGTSLGRHAIVNTSASVDHDCVVGDFAHVCPGVHLAGGVTLGEGAMIGTGAAVIPGTRIGVGAIVGAASAVVRDVPDGATVAGCPAQIVD